MSTLLLTGGAGFIGSHLCDALTTVGDQVRVLDDLSTALRPSDAPGFNVCTGISASVEALVRLIAELSGNDVNVQPRPARVGEIRHSVGVPALADRILVLTGRVPLRTSLGSVLSWMAAPTG